MELNINLDSDVLEVIQDYLDDIKFKGTPEEYFAGKTNLLIDEIIKYRWLKINKVKSTSNKVLDIKKAIQKKNK
jgi:hypothetical protein